MAVKSGERQMSMIVPNVEEFVSAEHRYRKLLKLISWVELARALREAYSEAGRRGYPVEQGLKCLFLQFLEDRSDRQMEAYLRENLAAKFFCNYGLRHEVPDHSYFGKFRELIARCFLQLSANAL